MQARIQGATMPASRGPAGDSGHRRRRIAGRNRGIDPGWRTV